MRQSELLAVARECMHSVETYYVKREVPILLTVTLPRRMVHVELSIEVGGIPRVVKRELTAAYDVVMSRRMARVHPQLAVDRAPRYVVLSAVYCACVDFLDLSNPGPARLNGLVQPPGFDRANTWLQRHDYPALGM